MDLIFKQIEEDDYDTLCEFWKFWKFPIIPKEFLPENGTGGIKICNEHDDIICAGFLYQTNSKIAWIEFIVSNPEIKDKKVRHDSQIELISLLVVEAEEKGFKAVFSSVVNPSLINKFAEVGFTKNKSNSTELMMAL